MAAQLPGLLVAMFLGAVDQTIMAPALPAVAADLGGLHQIPAVLTAYLLAVTVTVPIYGKLGDRFGRRPVMLAAIAIFVVGAAACGLAGSMAQLAACRALQGVGGGGLSIGAQAIIGEIISPRERGRYLGYIGATYVVAAVGGPLLGGLLIDRWSWRLIFAMYVPLGIAAAAAILLTLRLPRPESTLPVDYLGAGALALAVAGIVVFGATHQPSYLLAVVLGAVGWVVTARRAPDPILPLSLFTDRGFTVPVLVSSAIGVALFGVISYLPTYLQVVDGLTATRSGLVLTAMLGGVLVSTVWSGRMITRTGRYKPYPVVGTALAAAGMAALASSIGAGLPVVAGLLAVIGLGIGLVMQVMVLVAQNAASYAVLGVATSSVTFFRQIGAAVGVAVVGLVLVPSGAAAADVLAARLPLVLWAMVPVLAVAWLLTLMLPVLPLRRSAHAGGVL